MGYAIAHVGGVPGGGDPSSVGEQGRLLDERSPIDLTIQRWLELKDDEVLELERGEDLDLIQLAGEDVPEGGTAHRQRRSRANPAEESTHSDGTFVTMLATVPVRHDPTLYQKWGDWFAWIDLAALATLLAFWPDTWKLQPRRRRLDEQLNLRGYPRNLKSGDGQQRSRSNRIKWVWPTAPRREILNPGHSMAKQRSITSNLGLYVYGGAAIFLGLLGLVSGDFATNWQNVGPNVPLRVPLAYLTAVIELAGGIALLLPRTARAGALTLTIVYSVFTLIWVPKAFVNLGNYDPIGNVFEEFALVAAGLVLCAIFSPAGSSIARRRPFFVLLFGICPISFGIVHIIDMPGLLGGIPGWLPPTKMFWAYATTMGFFGAAVAILTGIMAPLAARLLTAEIVIFELLFWIPHLSGGPNNHFNWAGNAISIALAGAVWVVSDSISAAAKTKSIPAESPGEVSIPV